VELVSFPLSTVIDILLISSVNIRFISAANKHQGQ
jgi:hypothetical protein